MKHSRQRFQSGSLRKVVRKTGFVWEYRYRDHSQPGSPLRQLTLPGTKYPTKSSAEMAIQPMLLKINGKKAFTERHEATFGTLVQKFIESEKLIELRAMPPGDAFVQDSVQYSTAVSYLSSLNRYILPRWGDTLITDIKAAELEDWLRSLTRLPKPGQSNTEVLAPLAPKTKGNIKSLMYRLMNRAMFWDLLPRGENPVGLVEIRGVTKRRKRPFILTVEQYHAIIEQLDNDVKVMVQVAMCLGLRVSEILALKWEDFDFDSLSLMVVRAAVDGRVSDVKTEYSEDELPLDSAFADLMLDWKSRCAISEGGWVFPSPETGWVYHASPICQDYIRPAGQRAGLTKVVGWHTFRHAYRSFLDAAGAPMGVQQKLMRHASIQTTMNIYGNAQMTSKRTANTNIVKMVLPAREGLALAS